MQNHKLSKFLKMKRIKAGLTQKEVSDLLGYSTPQFVSNWERGLCRPPMESLGKLVSALNINSMELIDIYLTSMKTELKSVLKKSGS